MGIEIKISESDYETLLDIGFSHRYRTLYFISGYGSNEELPPMSLREFLDTMGITAEDCQKAFDEGEEQPMAGNPQFSTTVLDEEWRGTFEEVDDEPTDVECFYCGDKLRDDEVKAYHDKRTCDACHYLLVEYAKSTETEANNAD